MLQSKVETIGMNLLNLKAFKQKAARQILDIEAQSKNYIQLAFFRSEQEACERRMRELADSQEKSMTERMVLLKEELHLGLQQQQDQSNQIKKETLWEI